MARNKLTNSGIRTPRPGWHGDGDGDGLWLRTSAAGTSSWVFVWIKQGRRREMGLGPFGRGAREVTLAAARQKAEAVRAILGRGGDPFTELPERVARRPAKTFGQCIDDVLAAKLADFRNPKHRQQWEMTLREYARPLHKIPVAEVTTDDVLRVVRPIWRTKAETASRLRGRIEAVLDYATALKLRAGDNPARFKGHLDHLLGKRDKLTRGHFAAMPYGDIPAFMVRLRDVPGFSARALELTILSATRSNETLSAQWSEFDLDAATWTIPAARTKMKREHVVPLSDAAARVVRDLADKRMSDWVFPSIRAKRPISNMAMTAVLKRMGIEDATVHGFRSGFRDWCGDATNFPREVAEEALAHRVGDATERAYRRGSALEKRRSLMEAWSRYCTTPPTTGNVVPLRA